MENLSLINYEKTELPKDSDKLALNVDTGAFFVASKGCLSIYDSEENASQNMIDYNGDSPIISAEHLPELDSVAVVSQAGEIYICDLGGFGFERVPLSTLIPDHQTLSNAVWNPNQTVCILIDSSISKAYRELI